MRNINGIAVGTAFILATVGCSLTKLDPINEGSAGAQGDGGSSGEPTTGGRGNKGGSSAKGGTSSTSSNTTAGASSLGGTSSIGGSGTTTATDVGGTTGVGGFGGSSASGASTGVTGGTSSLGGSSAKATGGTSTTGGSSTGGTSAASIVIATPTLPTGKTYVAYSGTITASGATSYSWSISSGALPAGLTLQNTTGATVTIAGTPTEAGLFPVVLSVTNGTSTNSVSVAIEVAHKVVFLADRRIPNREELFLTEVGTATAMTPVQLSANVANGGNVLSYAFSPDGSKLVYTDKATGSSTVNLWLANLVTPGTATQVNIANSSVANFTWLGTGNVAAYGTAAGDLYMVDLNGTTPTNKLVAGLQTYSSFVPSITKLSPAPNGKSLIAEVTHKMASAPDYHSMEYVTWNGAAAAPTVTAIVAPFEAGGLGSWYPSHDGRFLLQIYGIGDRVFDLSQSTVTASILGIQPGMGVSWDRDSESLLVTQYSTSGGLNFLTRFSYASNAWSNAILYSQSGCLPQPGPWSPDGADALFHCGTDLRLISSANTAVANTSVSLLPSGFLINSFTGISTEANWSPNWSPNSAWIAARADRDTDTFFDLFLFRRAAPGTAHRLSTTAAAPGISTWSFAPNSLAVAFVGTTGSATTAGLYFSALPTSGTPTTPTLLSASGGLAVQIDLGWLPGSRVVLHRANTASGAQVYANFVSSTGTVSSPLSISGATNTGVLSYQVAPSN